YSSHIRWRPSPSTLQPYSPLFRSVLVADALHPYFGESSYTVGIGQSFDPAGWASIDTLCYARWDTSRPYEGPEVVEFSTPPAIRSEEHTSELQSRENLVCRLLLEK